MNHEHVTLLGKPLSQSFAARMQNRAYEEMGLALRYDYTEVDETELAARVSAIRADAGYAGFAVTKPNKVAVLPLLDETDPLCRRMGACNTVVRTAEGRLIGYNTDGLGFLTSLEQETDVDIKASSFFCFGAGGAGRAICSALAYAGAKKIVIADVFPRAADSLASDIAEGFGADAVSVPFSDRSMLCACDVIINATGVGMGASIGQTPLPEDEVLPGKLYFDACYNPDRTQFLLNAEKKGCRVLNGLGMSLFQGIAQIRLWTGLEAPVEIMRRELADILAERAWTENHADSGLFR